MFLNLQAEIGRKGIKNFTEFASLINMNSRTFAIKMSGKTEFKLSEMKSIKEVLGNEHTLEYLFAEIKQEG